MFRASIIVLTLATAGILQAQAQKQKSVGSKKGSAKRASSAQIDYSKYDRCPNGKSWDDCDHEGEKAEWLREQRKKGYGFQKNMDKAIQDDTADKAKNALEAFEAENPELKGKAYFTSGSRTWEEQLDIILDPKRMNNYPNIKDSFKKKFQLDALPAKSDLTAEQLSWWEKSIMKQAGKSPGFPHVGGKAQDISVKNLDFTAKKILKAKLEAQNLKILPEKVTRTTSEYGVPLKTSNVFHVHQ